MVECGEHHLMPDESAVAYRDPALILKTASGIDKNIPAERDILAEVRIYRWEQRETVPHLFPDKLGHKRVEFLRRVITPVDLRRDAALPSQTDACTR